MNNLWINRDSAYEKLCLSEISIVREYTGLKGQEFTQAWLPIPISIIKFLIAKNGVSLLLACLATGHHWNRCRLEGTQSFLCLESHQSHVISSRLLSFTMSAPKGCIKHLFLPVLPVSLGDLAQASSFNYVYNAARSQPAPPSS